MAAVGDAGQLVGAGHYLQGGLQQFALFDLMLQGRSAGGDALFEVVVQGGVFDGDGGLAGEKFERFQILVGEDGGHRAVFHVQRSDAALASDQRHTDHGADAQHVHAAGIAQPGVGEGIGGHQILLAVNYLLQDGLADIGFGFFDFSPVASAP